MEEHRLKVCTEYGDKKIFGPKNKDEMTGHVMRMTEKKKYLEGFWWRSLKDAGLLENLERGMKIILK